jgi:hypothetical protein
LNFHSSPLKEIRYPSFSLQIHCALSLNSTHVGIGKINLIRNYPHGDIFNLFGLFLESDLICISVIIVVALIVELSEYIRALKYPRKKVS